MTRHILGDFKGTYTGLTYSPDYSPVGWGEVEAIIDDEQIMLSAAFGDHVSHALRDLGRAKELGRDMVALYAPGNIQSENLRMFTVGALYLIFNTKPSEDEPALMIPMETSTISGLLFNADQVERGYFDLAYTTLEDTNGIPGGFPRIELGGRAPIDI